MQNYPTILRCTQTTATVAFIIIGLLFTFAGCAQLYHLLGLTDEQTQDQVAKDQADRQQILNQARLTITDILTTALAAAGAIATGFLTKRLRTEKKISRALITGIEEADTTTVKKTVHEKAIDLGIEPKLHARVKALT